MDLKKIDDAIAERVMGWTPHVSAMQPRGDKVPRYWLKPDGHKIYMRDWKPSTDPVASKALRDRFALQFCGENRFLTMEIYQPGHYQFAVRDDEGATCHEWYAEADTEELAVALCALKAYGISVEETIESTPNVTPAGL